MRLIVVLTCLSMSGFAVADQAQAAVRENTVIASQELGSALQQFARQREVQLLYRSELVENRRTAGASGELTVEEALTRILGGTGLTFRYLGEEGITIVPLSAADPQAGTPPTPSPGAQASGGDAADPRMVLEEVVVTATKREESLATIPASITVVSGVEVERRNMLTFDDLVRVVPGVNVTSPANNAVRITIRGIAGEANTNPTTGVMLGNLSFTDAYVPHVTLDPNPFDMRTVEVLKGPQGTLFGASALNGALRFVPNEPEMGEFSGRYYLQYSDVSEGDSPWGGGAVVNMPLGERAALRLTGFHHDLPGWVDNLRMDDPDSNRGEQTGGRAILEFNPSDALSVSLMYAGQKTHHNDISNTDNFEGNLSSNSRPRASPTDLRYDLGSLTVSYDFGGSTLVSETGYIQKDYHGELENTFGVVPDAPLPLVLVYELGDSESWSQEFRLVSKDGADSRWSWVVGAFASQQDITQYGAYLLGHESVPPAIMAGVLDQLIPGLGNAWLLLGQPPYNAADIDVKVKEYAAFFDVTRSLNEQWGVSFGGRLYQTESGGTVDNSGLLMFALGYPNGRVLDDVVKDDGFNPKVSLQWRPSEGVNLYAAASKGYRVGGVQWGTAGLLAAYPAPDTFKTDDIWNYELGARTTWLDRTLSLDLTAFYALWNDPQVLILDPSGLGSYIDNVGQVESKGIEASLSYLFPIEGLSLRAAVAYTDARTTEDFNSATNQVVPSGTTWPLAPEWQTAATIAYERSIGDWVWGASFSHSYMSEAIYGITQPDTVFGDSVMDAQLMVGNRTWPTQPELSLTVNNLDDTRMLNTAYSGATFQSGNYIQPRTLMLRLSGRF